MKTTSDKRAVITAASSADGLLALGMRIMGMGHVVEWNEDGSCVQHGPESSHYEAGRAEYGPHLLFNTFWGVSHCGVHQLPMMDSMHQIDLGIIIRPIMVIMIKCWECVLQFLNEGSKGLAASKQAGSKASQSA